MSQINPYAPPTAKVADVSHGEAAAAIWNPRAAAAWSLVLGPIFCTYLHARNWEALGQPRKAATSRMWMWAAIAITVALVIAQMALPESIIIEAMSWAASFVILIAWYYSIGKSQQAFVTVHFGQDYPRRGWLKPLLAALGVFVAFIVAMIILLLVVTEFSGSA